MREAFGYPHLATVFGSEDFACPFAEGEGLAPQVNGDVEDGTAGNAHKFALCVGGELVVQAAKDAFSGKSVVVLNEFDGLAGCFFKVATVKAFKEKAACIVMFFWLENEDAGQNCCRKIHDLFVFLRFSKNGIVEKAIFDTMPAL